jgi:hypothetical protein
MTNEQILKKAIEKAVKNGWVFGKIVVEIMTDKNKSFDVEAMARNLCFQHSFARAFWAKEADAYSEDDKPWAEQPAWEYHLQQMVLEEDPIKYLEQFL